MRGSTTWLSGEPDSGSFHVLDWPTDGASGTLADELPEDEEFFCDPENKHSGALSSVFCLLAARSSDEL